MTFQRLCFYVQKYKVLKKRTFEQKNCTLLLNKSGFHFKYSWTKQNLFLKGKNILLKKKRYFWTNKILFEHIVVQKQSSLCSIALLNKETFTFEQIIFQKQSFLCSIALLNKQTTTFEQTKIVLFQYNIIFTTAFFRL